MVAAWLLVRRESPVASLLAFCVGCAVLVPEDGRVGAFWPGLFAALSQRPVTPLDGIIGSDDYFRTHVQAGTELDYALANGVGYIAVYLPGSLDDLLSAERAPDPGNWANLGRLRLWENRDQVDYELISERPVRGGPANWSLIRISAR